MLYLVSIIIRLVVADLGTGDYNMKLRVYKGTQLVTENTLIDLPTGVMLSLILSAVS